MARVFVSGAAGFVGFHSAFALLKSGHQVCGYDNLNDYYDPRLKKLRLEILQDYSNFSFVKADLTDTKSLQAAWQKFQPEKVLHLAAQAGVRYSLEAPHLYIQSNIVGFQNIIELARADKITNFVYASSSSVYGGIKELPFVEDFAVNQPISLYAATKISNEMVAKSYSHLFELPTTGLRFFTAYGPYSRPDMAIYKFAELISLNQEIPVFGEGKMRRDYTYIDDIVAGIIAALDKPEFGAIYNLGKGQNYDLFEMIRLLETALGRRAKYYHQPKLDCEIEITLADIDRARKNLNYDPKTDLETGLKHFANWFQEYWEQ